MTAVKSIVAARERDAAWLVALYLAVYGGDPAPQEGALIAQELREAAALNAIAALSLALDGKAKQAVQQAITPLKQQREMRHVDAKVAGERLESFGIHMEEQDAAHPHHVGTTEASTIRPRLPYCIRFHGVVYCVPILSPGPILFE